MMGYGAGLGLGFGFGGLLAVAGCVLLVVGIVVLVAWALGHIGGARSAPSAAPYAPFAPAAQPDPVEILRMRLARGEISVEDFASAKHALETER